MESTIEAEDRFHIATAATLVEQRTLVLKQGDAFGIFNALGDIDVRGIKAQGLFVEGMRHLSRFETRLNGHHPLVLSSAVTRDNTHISADATNPEIVDAQGRVVLPHGALHLWRSKHIWAGGCYEQLTVTNFHHHEVEVVLRIVFAADFADIFEIRGTARERRGARLEPVVGASAVVLGYEGLDGIVRHTRIESDQVPEVTDAASMRLRAALAPGEHAVWHLSVLCEPLARGRTSSFEQSARGLQENVEAARSTYCRVDSSNDHFTAWLERSRADTRMLLTQTAEGMYPYAGIPWYSVPFGRDGIITAMQLLWVNPDVARGVLRYLAAHQAVEEDPERDAEPGKILHERRTDEMANLGEVPFGMYYGSVDSTPLFIMLAGMYFEHTGDRGLLESVWPNVEAALGWIDRYGDSDNDGLVEYQARTRRGLANQGWKDSYDAVFHADGALAHGPIALCEVQAYVYDAKRRAAAMARALGFDSRASDLELQAERLRRRFEDLFWQDDLGIYALALDGQKRPCRVRTSNAGQVLFGGIASRDRARAVAAALNDPSFFSGWGIRTVAEGQARYNPMSYHNGSVWPHDNSLIAAGFGRYGLRRESARILDSMFEASMFMESHRLPELFCGFGRRQGKGPTLYPVACSPQAWASGAAFMTLGAVLGLRIEGGEGRVIVDRPFLPLRVGRMRIRGLRVGPHTVDLLFHRDRGDVGVLVLGRSGPVELIICK